jgi:hypothetical protein
VCGWIRTFRAGLAVAPLNPTLDTSAFSVAHVCTCCMNITHTSLDRRPAHMYMLYQSVLHPVPCQCHASAMPHLLHIRNTAAAVPRHHCSTVCLHAHRNKPEGSQTTHFIAATMHNHLVAAPSAAVGCCMWQSLVVHATKCSCSCQPLAMQAAHASTAGSTPGAKRMLSVHT